MKKLLFFILTIALSNHISSQSTNNENECHYRTKKIDAFTKKEIVELNDEPLGIFGNYGDKLDDKTIEAFKSHGLEIRDISLSTIGARAKRENDTVYIDIYSYFLKAETYSIIGEINKDESYIIFLFNDETTLELKFLSSSTGSRFSQTINMNSFVQLSKEDVSLLLNKSISKIRIKYSKKEIDYECDNPDIFKRQLICVFSEIN